MNKGDWQIVTMLISLWLLMSIWIGGLFFGIYAFIHYVIKFW